MSRIVNDANVDVGAIETDHGDVAVVLLNVEAFNRLTEENEEIPLVLTVRDANTLGQLLITITNTIDIEADRPEEETENE